MSRYRSKVFEEASMSKRKRQRLWESRETFVMRLRDKWPRERGIMSVNVEQKHRKTGVIDASNHIVEMTMRNSAEKYARRDDLGAL